MKTKPITYIVRGIFLILLAGILFLLSRQMLFPVVAEVTTPVNTEHFVIPVKSGIIKDALKTLGTVTSSSDGIKVTVPTAAADKLGLGQIQANAEMYGSTVSRDVEQVVVTLKEGDGSTILVPVPMLVSLIDRGVLTLKP